MCYHMLSHVNMGEYAEKLGWYQRLLSLASISSLKISSIRLFSSSVKPKSGIRKVSLAHTSSKKRCGPHRLISSGRYSFYCPGFKGGIGSWSGFLLSAFPNSLNLTLLNE